MASLPQPDLDCSLVLRTDFSDDKVWDVLKAAIDSFDDHGAATCVSDPAYLGVGVHALVEADAAASDDDKLTHLFLADATTMTDDEHRLLAVDLYTEPGHGARGARGRTVVPSVRTACATMVDRVKRSDR
jgi:hypothetical protein